jgi:hypothetical protein
MLTLSDPAPGGARLERLLVRQTALGASGLRKGDHIVDLRTHDAPRGRAAAWVALPRPATTVREGQPRIAATAVADALTTAFMMLDAERIAALCTSTPGLRAWVLRESSGGEPRLLSFGS